mmetsp:Transcript_15008/g.46966  ORF Transcript_15008/g.46966 Transcript_15008/m.46966 type:complete len:236 (-) Transcript_15008:399-1106(-)
MPMLNASWPHMKADGTVASGSAKKPSKVSSASVSFSYSCRSPATASAPNAVKRKDAVSLANTSPDELVSSDGGNSMVAVWAMPSESASDELAAVGTDPDSSSAMVRPSGSSGFSWSDVRESVEFVSRRTPFEQYTAETRSTTFTAYTHTWYDTYGSRVTTVNSRTPVTRASSSTVRVRTYPYASPPTGSNAITSWPDRGRSALYRVVPTPTKSSTTADSGSAKPVQVAYTRLARI